MRGGLRSGGGASPGLASPPAGYYDSGIDAQLRASGRGLADLLAQQSTDALRGANDYSTARGDIFRERDESLADMLSSYQRQGTQFDWQQQDMDTDYGRSQQQFGWQRDDLNRGYGRDMEQLGWQRSDLDTGYGRSMEDSRLGEGRLREDYGFALEDLNRGYRRLAGNQAQAFSSAGLSGGAFGQASAKRAENMAIDRRPIDTGFNRGLADLLSARQRTTEDYGTNSGRLDRQQAWTTEDFNTNSGRLGAQQQWSTDDYNTNRGRLGTQRGWADQDYGADRQRVWDAADRAGGQLDVAWQRQNEDWRTQRDVAGRENTLFGLDANQTKWQQARQLGYRGQQRRR